MSKGTKLSKNQLEFQLQKLNQEYRLAREGLRVGGITALAAIAAVVWTFFGAAMKMELLSGNNIVMIVGIVAISIVIYFSFVFRRVIKTRLEISETKALLEMASGKGAEVSDNE